MEGYAFLFQCTGAGAVAGADVAVDVVDVVAAAVPAVPVPLE